MKTLLLTLCLALATSVHAEVISLKGKNGRLLDFDLRELTAQGVRGVPAGQTEAIFVPWSSLDLTWLQANNAALDRRRTAAIRETDPLAHAAPPATLAVVKQTVRAALGRQREWGWPNFGGKSKTRQDALHAATYGKSKFTSALKILTVASDRGNPVQRDALLWIKGSPELIDAISTTMAIALQQVEAVPATGDTRTFAQRVKEAQAALDEIKTKPVVEKTEWVGALRGFVALL